MVGQSSPGAQQFPGIGLRRAQQALQFGVLQIGQVAKALQFQVAFQGFADGFGACTWTSKAGACEVAMAGRWRCSSSLVCGSRLQPGRHRALTSSNADQEAVGAMAAVGRETWCGTTGAGRVGNAKGGRHGLAHGPLLATMPENRRACVGQQRTPRKVIWTAAAWFLPAP